MQTHQEDEEEGLLDALAADQVVPAKQRGHEHAVTETRDREEFRDALNEAHDDGLEVAERGVHSSTLNQRCGSLEANGARDWVRALPHHRSPR